MRPEKVLTSNRYEFATSVIDSTRKGHVGNLVLFDCGARDGIMKAYAGRAGAEWHGFDLKPMSPDVVAWDLNEPLPKSRGQADIILLLDVLEHLSNPGIALKNIAGALRPRGTLVITVPNPRWSRSRINALLTGYPTCFTQSDLEQNGHVFVTFPHILLSMLNRVDFDIDEIVTLDGKTAWPGRPITYRYPLRLVHSLACKMIEAQDPSACGMSFGLVARLRSSDDVAASC